MRFPVLMLSGLSLVGCLSRSTAPPHTGDTADFGVAHCGELSGEEVWDVSAPHVLTCDVTVTGQLTLDPGVEVYAHRDTALRVTGGSLVALGAPDAEIVLLSVEDAPLAGDWVGLVADSADLQLAWVKVAHGGSDGALVSFTDGTAAATELTLSHSISTGLYATGTAFEALQGVHVDAVPTPLELPWAAAEVLGEVSFESVGTEAILLGGSSLTHVVTLPEQTYPYRTYGVTVDKGGQLTLEAGVVLELGGDVVLASGTHSFKGASLIFDDETGLTLSGGFLSVQESFFGHEDETAGAWRGITASAGELSLVDSTVAYGGADAGANLTVSIDATITGNTIRDSEGWGIWVEGKAAPTIEGNTYENNALGDVGP